MSIDAGPAAPVPTTLPSRPRLRAEVLIVLGLSLGQSAVYAVITLIRRYLVEAPVGDQSTQLNPSYSDVDWLNLIYQVLRIGFSLMPVALALYLLSAHGGRAFAQLGLTRIQADGSVRAWWKDVVWGLALAAVIGLPGLALYAVGRALGQSVRIDTSGLPDAWWAALILLLSAAAAGLLEEILVVGYLVTRLRQMRWGVAGAVAASALLRGSYHLYQGWPMALGNVVMGVVFALYFVRTGRVGPLILAHWTLDAVSFIGPEVVPDSWLDVIHGA